jgi:hypothetical protein
MTKTKKTTPVVKEELTNKNREAAPQDGESCCQDG